jgi:hypothetical protein
MSVDRSYTQTRAHKHRERKHGSMIKLNSKRDKYEYKCGETQATFWQGLV